MSSDAEWAVRDQVKSHIADTFTNSPSFLFYIAKSTNTNIVCYQANLDPDAVGRDVWRDEEEPVAVFWQLIDAETVAKRELKGKTDVTSELTYVQRKMAYGVSGSIVGDEEVLDSFAGILGPGLSMYSMCELSLVALPERCFMVVVYGDGSPGSLPGAAALTKINGEAARLTRVFVKVVPGKWISAWPTVTYVVLQGVSLVTGEPVEEMVDNTGKKPKPKKRGKGKGKGKARGPACPADGDIELSLPQDPAPKALLKLFTAAAPRRPSVGGEDATAGSAPDSPAAAPAPATGLEDNDPSAPSLAVDIMGRRGRGTGLGDDADSDAPLPSPLGRIRRHRRRRRRRSSAAAKPPPPPPSSSSSDETFVTANDTAFPLDETDSSSF